MVVFPVPRAPVTAISLLFQVILFHRYRLKAVFTEFIRDLENSMSFSILSDVFCKYNQNMQYGYDKKELHSLLKRKTREKVTNYY